MLGLTEISALFDEQERNREWFEKNYDHLVGKYDGMFVAIHRESVVECSRDPAELRQRIHARGLKLSEVMVEYVSRKPLEFMLCIKGNKVEEECLATNMRTVFSGEVWLRKWLSSLGFLIGLMRRGLKPMFIGQPRLTRGL